MTMRRRRGRSRLLLTATLALHLAGCMVITRPNPSGDGKIIHAVGLMPLTGCAVFAGMSPATQAALPESAWWWPAFSPLIVFTGNVMTFGVPTAFHFLEGLWGDGVVNGNCSNKDHTVSGALEAFTLLGHCVCGPVPPAPPVTDGPQTPPPGA